MTALAGLRLARVSCVPGAGRGPGGRSHGLNTRHRSTRDSTRDRIRQPVCSINAAAGRDGRASCIAYSIEDCILSVTRL